MPPAPCQRDSRTPEQGSGQQLNVVCFNVKRKRNKHPKPTPCLSPKNKDLSFLFCFSRQPWRRGRRLGTWKCTRNEGAGRMAGLSSLGPTQGPQATRQQSSLLATLLPSAPCHAGSPSPDHASPWALALAVPCLSGTVLDGLPCVLQDPGQEPPKPLSPQNKRGLAVTLV